MPTSRCSWSVVINGQRMTHLQVAMSHLAWAVGKSCREPAPKKVLEGDYWTQHAKNFIDIREKEMRPATAEASLGYVHKVAVGINEEIKAAAFEGGNTTALKFIANYGRDLRRRTRQLLKPANMQVGTFAAIHRGCPLALPLTCSSHRRLVQTHQFIFHAAHDAVTLLTSHVTRHTSLVPSQNIQNAAGLGAHFPIHHTDVTMMLAISHTHLPLHLPQQVQTDHAHRNTDVTRYAC